jgi:origin recognition complex subunit 3
MCHFYANPLSVLLAVPSIDPESLHIYLTTTHLNDIRSLPSMRKYIEEKLAEKDTEEVKSLLNDDSYLTSLLPQFVDLVETRARELREAVIVLTKLSERGVKTRRRLGDLYLSTLMGEINLTTPFVRELLQLQR